MPALANEHYERVRAWIDRVEDLSGLLPDQDEWLDLAASDVELKPLLGEIGRFYAPFLLANAKAVMAGDDAFETEIDGRPWSQPTFHYQAKCLQWIREIFGTLPPDDKVRAHTLLEGTGCEPLLG
jgi:hypothetical protein